MNRKRLIARGLLAAGVSVSVVELYLFLFSPVLIAQMQETAKKQEPAAPLLVINYWPGEGVPVIETAKGIESLTIHSEPRRVQDSRVVKLSGPQKLRWDQTKVLVLKKGEYEMGPSGSSELTLVSGIDGQGNLHYEQQGTLTLSPGEKFDVLCYRAEGFYLFDRKGQLFEMFGEDKGRFLREPETEWWVHVTEPQELSGWVRVDSEKVKVTDRTF